MTIFLQLKLRYLSITCSFNLFPIQLDNVVLVDLDNNTVTDDTLDTKLPSLPTEAVQIFKSRSVE